MHYVGEPSLNERIESFIGRKSREFPDLHLLDEWDEYEYAPKQPNFRPNKVRNT